MRKRASSTGSDLARRFLTKWREALFGPRYIYLTQALSEVNLHAMRLGPGKHLKGLSLFNGLVKPEEVSSLYIPIRRFCPDIESSPPV